MSGTPLVTVKTYCERVGMTRSQGYRAAKDGSLPTVTVGGKMMVPVARADRKLGIAQDVPAQEVETE